MEEGIQFTEATEFCRSIAVDEDKPDAAAAAPREMDGDVDMEDAMEGGAAPADAPPPADKMEEDGGAAEGAEGEEAAKDEEPAAGGSSGAVFTGNSMGKVLSLPPFPLKFQYVQCDIVTHICMGICMKKECA